MNTEEHITYLMHQLEAAGRRATPQRHAVCRALVDHGAHPTVADIFERVRATFPMISQATVYNTIDTLEELGLLRRLDIANHDHTHYDLDTTPHVNMVCRHCETIVNVSIHTLDALLTQVSDTTGFDVDRNAGLIIYGVCPTCKATGKKATANNDEVVCTRKRKRLQARHHQATIVTVAHDDAHNA